jgi:ComF family protein
VLSFLLDCIFPKVSLLGEMGQHVTEREVRELKSYPICIEGRILRERGMKSLDRVIAAAGYADSLVLRRAIHALKYGRCRALIPVLAPLLCTAAERCLSPDSIPILCPVPLHWTRRFSRGFNQSHLLAVNVGQMLRWPAQELLSRVRPTGSQARRSRAERREALAQAFRVRRNMSLPRRVILIDDLCTTGATLEACAHELKNAGVERVEGLVIACA